ncbi:MAG: hypothetical protein DRO62_00955 [Candidatus Altiarchaeales archaeon]|nr:MAG: hypothetical protein DRO62_00955 [Candidatus Altiarchaeales archaeon]
MKPRDIVLGLMLLYLLLNSVSALSVGTAPGVYDLGELDPGTNVAFRFYLITNARNDMLVSLSYLPVHQDMYYRTETTRYNFIADEASQEDISSWVEIVRNPLLLSPARTKVVYLPGGGVVKANEEADIILHIPENADPGYHAGSISLSPKLAVRGRGTGVMTIAVTRFIFVFRVSGDAKRKGEIMAIMGDRVGEKKAKIDVLFKNTGTCTLSARVSELKLYDKFGNNVANLKSGIALARPDSIKALTAYWVGDNVKPGTYRAEARVDYITGYSTMEERIEIPTTIKVKPTPGLPAIEKISTCKDLPFMILLLIIIGLIIYWLDWKYREIALLIVVGLLLISIALFVFNCLVVIEFSWLDLLFAIIILALIIYWWRS